MATAKRAKYGTGRDDNFRRADPGSPENVKVPFSIGRVVQRIRAAVAQYAAAAMFELAEDGYDSVFQQLIACLISIRTYDEVSLVAARRLFERAGTAEELRRLPASRIDALISPATYHTSKAYQIRSIAERVASEFNGVLPCDADVLMSFKGVGPKCANLALGVACGQQRISVDVHVWRVTNRWGYVQALTPEAAMGALEGKLPKRYWIEINRLLVPFGKHICTGTAPKCSECPVLAMCRQVGVTKHR
jgi:endonuclease III